MNGTPRILLVDDEPGVLVALKMLLSLSPAAVTTAGSATEAVNAYKEKNFEYVVSDLRMPETDGIELFQALQKLSSDLKFILISGHADERDKLRATATGIKAFLPKPFSLEDFRKLVGSLS